MPPLSERLRLLLRQLLAAPSPPEATASGLTASSGSAVLGMVQGGGGGAAGSDPPPRPDPPPPTVRTAPVPEGAARRFLLSVDGGGQYLVAAGAPLVIGHLRAGRAELPFLADVGPEHALLTHRASLREGPVWSVASLHGERVEVDGASLQTEARKLVEGTHVQLGENLAFVVRVPDPASDTVVLELLHGAECAGAIHVVLLGQGEGGRLRIGSAGARHVRVPNLEHDVEMVLRGYVLAVRSTAGVRGTAGEPGEVLTLPCPPPGRVDLSLGKPRSGRPPFGITLSPTGLPEPRRIPGGDAGSGGEAPS